MAQRYIIIGGVAAGMSAAARLRRLDEDAEIIVFERGEYVSFANCGLPYYAGGVIADRSKLLVQTPAALRAELKLDVRTQTEVVGIDTSTKTVTAENSAGERQEVAYDALILAPGAAPVRPPLPGIDDPRVFTVRSIPDAEKIKAKLAQGTVGEAVVVGGGFVGLEMAENLARAGVQIHLVEMAKQVLPSMLDPDMAALVHNHLRSSGVALRFGTPVTAFRPEGERLCVDLEDGTSLPADMVILAIGVRPEVGLAKQAGLRLGPRGGIAVDRYLRTSDPHVYAVGDCIEVCDLVTGAPAIIPLAGPANKQGRIAADNVRRQKTPYNGTQGTAIVQVMGITVAGTGATSQTLHREGIAHQVSITHSFSHAVYYPGSHLMAIKLLFAQDGHLLGAQIVGTEGVDKRIDVLATVLRLRGTVGNLHELELAYAPPFSSAKDPVNIAGYVAQNLLAGDVATVQAEEVPGLVDRVTFVDVRRQAETAAGSIAGSLNVPLAELRSRLSEIPRDKPVVVYCRVGYQAYLACRVLQQRGFANVANLAGGWRTYSAMITDTSAQQPPPSARATAATEEPGGTTEPDDTTATGYTLDVSGLSCPGPIARVHEMVEAMPPGSILEVRATDPGFAADIAAWCRSTGHRLLESQKRENQVVVCLEKSSPKAEHTAPAPEHPHDKTIVVFSGDLDRVLAAFVIANGALAMNRKVTMFFTFWGLNALRRKEPVRRNKDVLARMFGMMMPRGSSRLGLSRLHMMGIGPRLIRRVMRQKGIASLEELMAQAMGAGVRVVACQMSMDVMGIGQEELLPGVEIGGVASYLAASETADATLFI